MTLTEFSMCDAFSAGLRKKSVIGIKVNLLPTKVTIDQGNLVRKVIISWNEDLLNVDHLMHDNWVAYFKT